MNLQENRKIPSVNENNKIETPQETATKKVILIWDILLLIAGTLLILIAKGEMPAIVYVFSMSTLFSLGILPIVIYFTVKYGIRFFLAHRRSKIWSSIIIALSSIFILSTLTGIIYSSNRNNNINQKSVNELENRLEILKNEWRCEDIPITLWRYSSRNMQIYKYQSKADECYMEISLRNNINYCVKILDSTLKNLCIEKIKANKGIQGK